LPSLLAQNTFACDFPSIKDTFFQERLKCFFESLDSKIEKKKKKSNLIQTTYEGG